MHEAQAPQRPIEDWKDFLYHIFYVSLGLLLAIGLEQAVVYANRAIQIAELRSALAEERAINIEHFAVESEEIDRVVPILKKNLDILLYLRSHPGLPKSHWPAELQWAAIYPTYNDTAWKTALTSYVFQYMPPIELRRLNYLYGKLQTLNSASEDEMKLKFKIYSTLGEEPDTNHLTPAIVEKQIDLCERLIESYALASRAQYSLHSFNPDFNPIPRSNPAAIFTGISISPSEKSLLMSERSRMYAKDELDNAADPLQ